MIRGMTRGKRGSSLICKGLNNLTFIAKKNKAVVLFTFGRETKYNIKGSQTFSHSGFRNYFN